MAMDARKQRILEAIVALYANDGEPVGSGLLANYFDMALSSATLRNEMAALTKLGLLEQPHTSAGRVPSAQGYRYYLDHLIDAPSATTLSDDDRRHIDDLFACMDAEPEKLVPAAARSLADLTGCAAAATTPQAPDLCIAHFEVVQVGRYSAAALAVTSAGGVRTRVARVDTGLTRGRRRQSGAAAQPRADLCGPAGLEPDADRQHGTGSRGAAGARCDGRLCAGNHRPASLPGRRAVSGKDAGCPPEPGYAAGDLLRQRGRR